MKKILALALALIMVLALAACGGGNETPDPSGSNDNTPSSSQQQPSSTPDEQSSNPPSEKPVFTDGEWPDNEWNLDMPEPPFPIGELEYIEAFGELTIHLSEVTYDEIVAYCEQINAIYNDSTVRSVNPINNEYWWRTNVHGTDSILWTIDVKSESDGTGTITINDMR